MKSGLVLVAALLSSCGTDPQTGTGSQTGNSVVAGRLSISDSTSAAGTVVYLRPLDWTPSQTSPQPALQTTTDSNGDFVFQNVPPHTYRIEARHGDHGWSKTVKTTANNQAVVPPGTLKGMGRLLCEVTLTDSTRGGFVELYGLDRSLKLPAVGSYEFKYSFDSLPPGLHTLRIWSSKTRSVIFEKPVRIGTDSISKVEYEPGEVEFHGPVEDD